jgi:hypothetical protein
MQEFTCVLCLLRLSNFPSGVHEFFIPTAHVQVPVEILLSPFRILVRLASNYCSIFNITDDIWHIRTYIFLCFRCLVARMQGKIVIQRELTHQLRYLGTTVTNQNLIVVEINWRLISGNDCYCSVQNVLSSRLLSKNAKIKIYKTIIFPMILYGCETWSLTLREERRLRVFLSYYLCWSVTLLQLRSWNRPV